MSDREHWMRRCLALASRAAGRTAPNPMVGCVVVGRDGELLAEGWHRRAGQPHAEAMALSRLGGRAPGATLYVNLEPCVHTGRTPPCAAAIAEAGVNRVVFGMGDPIRSHAGGAWLRRRGVTVERGVLREECEELNRAFVRWALEKRPWFCLKAGMSLDGKVATHQGESRWITGEAARRDVHRLRDRLDAIMVGIGTVRADRPRLSVRGIKGGRDPIRVVVDSRLQTPASAPLLPANSRSVRTIIATTRAAARTRERRLTDCGAEVWRFPDRADGRVSLRRLATRLAREGVTSVLVEGGPTLHAAMLKERLADEVVLYVAPMILGGQGPTAGLGWVTGSGVQRLRQAPRLVFKGQPKRVGDDLVLTARIQ